MKFIYLKSKVRSCELIALIILGGGVPSTTLGADCQTMHDQSVIVTCKEKFDQFFDQFSTIFKDSFSLESTEKFDVTGAKLVQAQKTLEELSHWLQDQSRIIAEKEGKHSVDYLYVMELIHTANEFFKKRFVPFVVTFNKHYNENTTKFVALLQKIVDQAVEESSFQNLKKHIDTLQSLCVKAGHTDIAEKYDLLWQVAVEARADYINNPKPAILLAKWSKRKPSKR